MYGGGRRRKQLSSRENDGNSNDAELEDIPLEFFEVLEETATESRSRNTKTNWFKVRFKRWTEANRPDKILARVLESLMAHVLRGKPAPSLVSVQVHPSNFDRPFIPPLRPPEQNNASALAESIMRLIDQSDAELDLFDGVTEFKVIIK
jgi:hypothetical protein